MSKNIKEILKNKMVVSGVIVAAAATIAVGMSATKKTSNDKQVENKVAQIEEFNKEEVKDNTLKTEDKVDSKVVQANVSEPNKVVNESTKTDLKTTKQPSSKIVKPKQVKKAIKKKISIKKTPIKVVDTSENLELLKQRDKLTSQIKNLKNDVTVEKDLNSKTTNDITTVKPLVPAKVTEDSKVVKPLVPTKVTEVTKTVTPTVPTKVTNDIKTDKPSDVKKVIDIKIVPDTKTEDLTNSKEVLEKIAEIENKIRLKRENIKALILKDLNSIKDINPKSISEIAILSNKVINITENAKAYNKMILDDKKSTEEMKQEAQNLLERSNKELKRITFLAEAISAKSKDLTWTQYLTNLYNYANGKISNVYNYVVEEGKNAYNDSVESSNNLYSASKKVYDTAKYTYNNFDNVKLAAKDLSQVSKSIDLFDKETSGVLDAIIPFVKDYKPTDSYLDITKEKANGVIGFVKAELNSNTLNKALAQNKKNTSIISPVTNVINNISNFTNSKMNKIKTAVNMSNGYIYAKEASKELFSSVLDIL